jgi:hypothetical protein
MTTDSATMTEQWQPTRHTITETIEKTVDLAGAPEIVANGGRCTPYAIRFVYQRRGSNGSWQAQITIYARTPHSVVGQSFSPDKVYMPAQWLTDLIDQATPDEGVTR